MNYYNYVHLKRIGEIIGIMGNVPRFGTMRRWAAMLAIRLLKVEWAKARQAMIDIAPMRLIRDDISSMTGVLRDR